MSFTTRILYKSDENQLMEFYQRQDAPRALNYCMNRTPSFFDALEVEGENAVVMAVIDDQTRQIVAAITKAIRTCYIGGQRTSIAYVGGLKIDKQYQKAYILYKLITSFLSTKDADPRFYLCSILDSNTYASQILTSGRASLPVFRKVSGYNTLIFKPLKGIPENIPGVEIVKASSEDLALLLDFLEAEGKKRSLFPVYTREQFLHTESGVLKHLDLNSTYLAFRNKEIIGMLSVWDQQRFKQCVLTINNIALNIVRPIINIYTGLKKIPALVPNGNEVPLKYFSLICILNDNPDIFRLLFRHACQIEYNLNKTSVLTLGFLDKDPLLAHCQFPCFSLKSSLYLFAWKNNVDALLNIDLQHAYVELATL